MRTISLFLFIPSIAVIAYLIFKDLKKLSAKDRSPKFKRELSLQIIAIPLLLVLALYLAFKDLPSLQVNSQWLLWLFSGVVSFLISMFWLLYLTWLDIYEREKPLYLIFTFVLGCAGVALVFPLTDLVRSTGLAFDGTFVADFAYSVIGIGLVEELVKFLPWFLILRFSRQVNEPFDYILYASVSALGFAFVENILYLERSGLTAVYARALYSSVAHMFFSSIIAYGIIWYRQRGVGFGLWQFLVLWFLAALAHGFYNFWLISVTYRAEFITLLFFLVTIHLWVLMKNNLINLSEFYDPRVKLRTEIFMYRLVNLMLVVLVVALVGHNFLNGGEATRSFFFSLISNYTYVFAYIVISFSSYIIVPGYLARFTLPGNWLVPKVIKHPNLNGKSLKLGHKILKPSPRQAGELINELLGQSLKIERRMVFDGDPYWYLTRYGQQPILLKILKTNTREDDVLHIINLLATKDKSINEDVHFTPEKVEKIGVMAAKEEVNQKA